MYRCSCGAMFAEPDYLEVCYEDYYGVSSMFPNRNYGTFAVCPECGSDDLEEIFCDEVCEDCSIWRNCTLDERKEAFCEG